MSVSSKQPFSFDLSGRVSPRAATPKHEVRGEKDGRAGASQAPAQGEQHAPEYKRVCMRLSCDLYGQVKAIAERKGMTVTEVVADALRMRVARPELFDSVWESQG